MRTLLNKAAIQTLTSRYANKKRIFKQPDVFCYACGEFILIMRKYTLTKPCINHVHNTLCVVVAVFFLYMFISETYLRACNH